MYSLLMSASEGLRRQDAPTLRVLRCAAHSCGDAGEHGAMRNLGWTRTSRDDSEIGGTPARPPSPSSEMCRWPERTL